MGAMGGRKHRLRYVFYVRGFGETRGLPLIIGSTAALFCSLEVLCVKSFATISERLMVHVAEKQIRIPS